MRRPAGGAREALDVNRLNLESHETMNLPVTTLTLLGALLALLGLFAAGSIEIVAVGLVAIFGAGLLEVAEKRH